MNYGKCDLCNERDASFFVQQSVNGKTEGLRLCPECLKALREDKLRGATPEAQARVDHAKALLQSVDRGPSFENPFFESWRDLMDRFNRPVTLRNQRLDPFLSWLDSGPPMRRSDPISIPEPGQKQREQRAENLIFHEDGTVTVGGADDDSDSGNSETSDTREAEQAEAQTPGARMAEEQDQGALTDDELRTMDFKALRKYCKKRWPIEEGAATNRSIVRSILERRKELAIHSEDYELAAELRDAIRELS